jgi:hypothetical protein
MYKTIMFIAIFAFLYLSSCSEQNKAIRQNTPIPQETTPETTQSSGTKTKTRNVETHRSIPAPALSEFAQGLQELGYNPHEIRELAKIERENYETILREIMFNGGHFYYDGFDVGQTPGNCGIYALRRKLKHMYELHMLADETAWYRLSDRQMRDLIVNGPNADPTIDRGYIYRGEILDCEDIVNLQIYMEIPIEDCSVLKTDGFRLIHESQIPYWINPFSIVLHRDHIVAIDPTPPKH